MAEQYAKLSPEQFNKLVTKEEFNEFKKEVATKDDIKTVLDAVDNITKEYENHKIEHVANTGAHERMDDKIEKIEKHVGLETANAKA